MEAVRKVKTITENLKGSSVAGDGRYSTLRGFMLQLTQRGTVSLF